ncbi:MAG: hypothetical protein K8T90_05225 [Planctomycetes bacterium]|nr:hypothetical protein [Planctomycetota bacterium]
MAGYAVVSLQDKFNGYGGRIGRDGAVRTSVGLADTVNQAVPLDGTWVELRPHNDDRRQVQIQNQSAAGQVFIRLSETNAGPAYRIDPGVTYSFPTGVSWRGRIFGMAVPAADIVFIEFLEPETAEE